MSLPLEMSAIVVHAQGKKKVTQGFSAVAKHLNTEEAVKTPFVTFGKYC